MLCLAMIVKDEARGIVRTLDSVRDHVDAFCILDTGSSDGTQDLVQETMQSLPGRLYEEPFVDFSTTRNRALELADGLRLLPDFDPKGFTLAGARIVERPEYTKKLVARTWRFMVSGDAFVEHPELLRALVARCEAEGAVAARIMIRAGGLEWPQTMLTRGGAGCAFGGVTHEAMNVPEGAKVIDADVERAAGLVVRYEAPANEDRRPRWLLDRELLEAELAGLTPEERGRRPREIFYLAQTYDCLGESGHAIALYRERANLTNGREDECFISLLRIARCYWRTEFVSRQAVLGAFAAAADKSWERLHAFFPESQWTRLGASLSRLQRAEQLHRTDWLDFVPGVRKHPWRIGS